MKNKQKYLFTSARLGFRNWDLMDICKMHEINADEKVMEFFSGIPTKEQTAEFVERMKSQFAEKGFCYFAVDKLENNEFIGFIGLSEQTYKADFTPCIDDKIIISIIKEGYPKSSKLSFNYIKNTANLERH